MRDKYTGDFEVWFDLSFSLDTVVTLNVKRLDSKVPRFEVSGPIGNADSISEIALRLMVEFIEKHLKDAVKGMIPIISNTFLRGVAKLLVITVKFAKKKAYKLEYMPKLGRRGGYSRSSGLAHADSE